jgi:hypothetical protein
VSSTQLERSRPSGAEVEFVRSARRCRRRSLWRFPRQEDVNGRQIDLAGRRAAEHSLPSNSRIRSYSASPAKRTQAFTSPVLSRCKRDRGRLDARDESLQRGVSAELGAVHESRHGAGCKRRGRACERCDRERASPLTAAGPIPRQPIQNPRVPRRGREAHAGSSTFRPSHLLPNAQCRRTPKRRALEAGPLSAEIDHRKGHDGHERPGTHPTMADRPQVQLRR